MIEGHLKDKSRTVYVGFDEDEKTEFCWSPTRLEFEPEKDSNQLLFIFGETSEIAKQI